MLKNFFKWRRERRIRKLFRHEVGKAFDDIVYNGISIATVLYELENDLLMCGSCDDPDWHEALLKTEEVVKQYAEALDNTR